LAERKFVATNPQVIDAVIAAVGEADAWIKDNIDAAAKEMSPVTGIPAPILEAALKRHSFGIEPLDDTVITGQQHIADTFLALGLIPKPIDVAAAVRRARP
jgi:sulfonate transport system substrate-binding protein